MAVLLDNYVQNNFGLFSTQPNQNGIVADDGAFILGFVESWGATKTKRIIVGSNSIQYYQDFINGEANRDFESTNEPGPLVHIFQTPKWDFSPFVAVIAPASNLSDNLYVFFGSYDTEDSRFISWDFGATTWLFDDDLVSNFWAACCCCNAALIGFSPSTSTNDLMVSVYDLASQEPYAIITEDTYDYYPMGAAFTDVDGEAGVIMAWQDEGVPVGLVYVPFSVDYGGYGTPVEISVASSVLAGGQSEVDIAYDKENGRIAFISAFFDADDDPNFKFVWELFVSDDGGATWDSIDLETAGLLGGDEDWFFGGWYIAHVRIMAGNEGGFLLGYTRVNSSGYARPYIHKLDFVNSGGDVNSYSIGEAKEIGTALGPWDENTDMSGPLFFKAPADMWPNIEPIGNIYVGYQIGNGNVVYPDWPQQSTTSVGFAIEQLNENAYPDTIDYSYVTETADTGEIVCSLKILDTPKYHMDYYNGGYVGPFTYDAVTAFNKYGTTVEISKYDPKDNFYIGGRSGYQEPVSYIVKAFLDSVSWNSPNQALNQSDYDEFIDRDLRKIFLPPAFFMEYTSGRSLSEVQLQTVYLCTLDGFTYEVRQIVPKFINSQIVYWEANLYNVGNFDVWSRGGGQT